MTRIAGLLLSLLSLAAHAELKAGDSAPDFTTQAALAGKTFEFSMAAALKNGPVVLYFYPKAFTSGCTVEAHNFAAANDQFKALHATIIGISTDDIGTLQKFSVSECGGKFAVAADPDGRITQRYDSMLLWKSGYASRTSYVIAPDGKVIYAYTAMSPDKHVDNTLKALRDWTAAQPRQ